MHKVLANKWRPTQFSSVIGQEHIVRVLHNSLTRKRVHHAYLITGTRGVGKTTIARILTKCFNCETGLTAIPCETCGNCQAINQGNFVDLTEVDAATNTRVDDMRILLENSAYSPMQGRYKVYIIDEVHMLSTSAFNAMLKTLEEPPEHLKFILATTEPKKVPAPIISRCLHLTLRTVSVSQLQKHITYILEQEKINYEEAAIHCIAQAANGSVRDSLSLLDQAIAHSSDNSLILDNVRTLFGSAQPEKCIDIFQAIHNQQIADALKIGHTMVSQGNSVAAILDAFCELLYQISLYHIQAQGTINHSIAILALQLSPEKTQLYYQIALYAKRDLGLSQDETISLDMALIRMHMFFPEFSSHTDNTSMHPKNIIEKWKSTTPVAIPSATQKPTIIKKPPSTSITSQAPIQNITTLPKVLVKKILPTAKTSINTISTVEKIITSVDVEEELCSSKELFRQLLQQLQLKGVIEQFAETLQWQSYENGVLVVLTSEYGKKLSGIAQKRLEHCLSKECGRKISLQLIVDNTSSPPILSQQYEQRIEIQKEPTIIALQNTLGFTIDEIFHKEL